MGERRDLRQKTLVPSKREKVHPSVHGAGSKQGGVGTRMGGSSKGFTDRIRKCHGNKQGKKSVETTKQNMERNHPHGGKGPSRFSRKKTDPCKESKNTINDYLVVCVK